MLCFRQAAAASSDPPAEARARGLAGAAVAATAATAAAAATVSDPAAAPTAGGAPAAVNARALLQSFLTGDVKVALGDDSHKVALVAQHTSETAFGKNPGIGANHHVQHLYTANYVWHNDLLNYTHMANMWMDGRTGRWSRCPPQPLTSRWGYVGAAAIHNLALRDVKNSNGMAFVPGFFYEMFEDEKWPKKSSESDGGGTKIY